MDSPTPFFFSCLLLLLLSVSSTATDTCAERRQTIAGATYLSIFHIHSKCSPFSPPTPPTNSFDSVLDSAKKDPARVAFLSSLLAGGPKPTTVPVASGQQIMQNNNYVLRVKLGSPGQQLYLALDTGSDAAWVPTSGCSGCPSSSAAFSPASSSTYKPMDCTSPMCPQFKAPTCSAAGAPCAFNQSCCGSNLETILAAQQRMITDDLLRHLEELGRTGGEAEKLSPATTVPGCPGG